MHPFLAITEDEIQRLSPLALVQLINRLVKAEAIRYGIPVSDVKASEQINVADGGIDLRVETSAKPPTVCRIPHGISGWQIKAENLSPSDLESELTKPEVASLIQNNGAYFVVCSHPIVDKPLSRRKEKIDQTYAKYGHQSNGGFYAAKQIADWLSEYPAIAIELFERPLNDELLEFNKWLVNDQRSNGYIDFVSDETRDNVINVLKDSIVTQGEVGRIFYIIGESGSGKTRLIQEAIKLNHLSNETFYAPDLESLPKTFFRSLAAHSEIKRLILVVDKCSSEDVQDLSRLSIHCDKQIVIIAIGNKENSLVRSLLHSNVLRLTLSPLSEFNLQRIVLGVYPYATFPQRIWISRSVSGNIALAISIAIEFKNNVELTSATELVQTPSVTGVLSVLLSRYSQQERRIMSLFSLFDYVGLTGNVSSHGNSLAKFANIDALTFREIVNSLISSGMLSRKGRFVFVTSHLIAINMARFAIETYSHQEIGVLFDSLPDTQSQMLMFTRLSQIGDESLVKPIVKVLLDDFEDVSQLADYQTARVFYTLLISVPKLGVAKLEQLLSRTPRDVLQKAKDARWAMINALRTMLNLKETCFLAAQLLRILAETESEPSNFADRATAIWNEVFHLRWSDSQLTVEQKVNLILEALNSQDDMVLTLGISALEHFMIDRQSASYVDNFVGYLPSPLVEFDTWAEFWGARKRGLIILESLLNNAVHVHKEQVFSLLINCASEQVIGLFEDVLRLYEVAAQTESQKRRIWETIQHTKSSYSSQMTAAQISRLNDLADRLVSNSYHDRLHLWLPSPAIPIEMESYENGKDIDSYIKDLAKEGFDQPLLLIDELEWLVNLQNSGYPFYVSTFGYKLGQLDTKQEWYLPILNASSENLTSSLFAAYLIGRAEHGDFDWVIQLLDTKQEEENWSQLVVHLTCIVDPSPSGVVRVTNLIRRGWVKPANAASISWATRLSAIDIKNFLESFDWFTSDDSHITVLFVLHASVENDKSKIDALKDECLELLSKPVPDINNANIHWSRWCDIAEIYVEKFPTDIAMKTIQVWEEADSLDMPRRNDMTSILNRAIEIDGIKIWDAITDLLLKSRKLYWSNILKDEVQFKVGLLPLDYLLEWADKNHPDGAEALAYLVPIGSSLGWDLLVRYGHNSDVEGIFDIRFNSGSWSGKTSDYYKGKLDVARQWAKHPDRAVQEWAGKQIARYENLIPKFEEEEEDEDLHF